MPVASAKLDWLQALRGIAAVSMVINHSVINLADTAYFGVANAMLTPLSAGVDLFFVISGFIMVHTTRNDPGGFGSATNFAVKRIQRVWPTNLVLTLVIGFLSFGGALLGDVDLRTRLIKSLLFVPASYSDIYGNQIIGQGWTLNFEVYFYAVFAVSLLFARWRWAFVAAWFGATLIVIPVIFGTFHSNIFQSYIHSEYPFDYMKVMTSPVIWEFVGGVIAGLIYRSELRIRNRLLCQVLMLASFVFVMWSMFSQFYAPSLLDGVAFTIFIAVVSIASKTIRFRRSSRLCYLGDISYTLYLQHLAVIIGLQHVYAMLGLESFRQSLFNIPVTVALCILMAMLTSKFFERDILEWTRSLFGRRDRSVTAAERAPA